MLVGRAVVVAGSVLTVALVSVVGRLHRDPRHPRRQGLFLPFTAPRVLRALIAAAPYLTVVALLGAGAGWLLRSTVGALAAVVGLLYVLPDGVVVPLLPGNAGGTPDRRVVMGTCRPCSGRWVAVVLAVPVFSLRALQRRLVYLPVGGPPPAAAAAVPGGRDVDLTTADGLTLGAWFVPGPTPDAPAVLVANGNGGHRGMRAPLARALSAAGLAVLLFDYRGFAGNPGSPDEHGLGLDVRAARSYLVEQAGVPEGRLLYYGESLGCAVVTGLAVDHPPAGLVLRSPFVDLAAVGSEHYPFLPVRLLLRDRYPVAEQIARVQAPTTVVYGTGDTVVPPAQSRRVAEAAAQLHRRVEVPDADHNDAELLDGEALVRAVAELAALTAGP